MSEYADRVSILKIKQKYGLDVSKQLEELEPRVEHDLAEITKVNQLLWDIENEIRDHERRKDFGPSFIRLARLVYLTNDKRAQIKREMDDVEKKQYVEYDTKMCKPIIGLMTHMGLGDHLICNGMVREFAKKYDVTTYVKKQYVSSVKHMFRDIDLNIIPVDDDDDAFRKEIPNTFRCGQLMGNNWIIPGFEWFESFYINVGIDPKLVRDGFFYIRSRDDEDIFYKKMIEHIGSDKYVVIHEDLERFTPIVVHTDLPVVRIGKGQCPVESDNIFDYCKVIEKAEEYHGFDSSFAWLVEFLKLRSTKTFLHQYVKGTGASQFTQFTVLKTPTY